MERLKPAPASATAAARGGNRGAVVVPTMCAELDYAGLDGVTDGGAAQRAWWDVTAPACSEERARETRASLLRYCKADTLAMVAVLRYLARGNPVKLDELGPIETTASIVRSTASQPLQ